MEASQYVRVRDSYVSGEPLKGLHSITTLLRRGSVRKFNSKAAATSSHSGSKDRAGSQLACALCEAVSTQLPVLLPEGGKPKLSVARFFWFHVYDVKSCDNTVP